jgi:hypothetical protein
MNNYDVGTRLQDCQLYFSYLPFIHNSRDDVENIDILISISTEVWVAYPATECDYDSLLDSGIYRP